MTREEFEAMMVLVGAIPVYEHFSKRDIRLMRLPPKPQAYGIPQQNHVFGALYPEHYFVLDKDGWVWEREVNGGWKRKLDSA